MHHEDDVEPDQDLNQRDHGPSTQSIGNSTIQKLLRHIGLGMQELMPNFVRAGLSMDEEVQRFATAMTEGEQHAFLTIDVRVTPFQARLVQKALREEFRA